MSLGKDIMKTANRHQDSVSFGATSCPILKCGILGIFAAIFSSYLLGFVMPYFSQYSGEYLDTIDSLVRGGAVMILYVVVLAPLIEEALFRYLIYNLARKFVNVWAAIVIQAVLFGLYHGNIIQITYAFLLGLLLGWIRKETDRFICCIAFHVLFNITGIILDRFSEIEQPLFIRILFMIVSLAVCVVTVFFIKERKSGCDAQTD